MKHLNLSVILLGVVLIIRCSMEPDAPKLIFPQEGEVFDTIPPTFIWSSEEYAEGYVIEVDKDTFGLGSIIGQFDHIWKYTSDTTYTMTQAEFDNLENFTYDWQVASLWTEDGDTSYNWSEWRSFVVDKPEEPQLDLDTTYFPFGLGYEWCFKRHEWGKDEVLGEWDYDATYTFKIEVVDILQINSAFYFVLKLEPTMNYFEPGFWDLSDSVKIANDQIEIRGVMIGLTPSERTDPFVVSYRTDTLVIGDSWFGGHEGSSINTKRLKAVGAISQCYSYWYESTSGLQKWENVRDTLLYFYNGQDTVYKAE
ncbi:MAG: hypothetical protein E3J71_01050 [Candidatus Stahlbacteria bacterium]|nr:MAG: hypothetical protein E3J71_01050 [Candidatus Stahlbacteria bacterium]